MNYLNRINNLVKEVNTLNEEDALRRLNTPMEHSNYLRYVVNIMGDNLSIFVEDRYLRYWSSSNLTYSCIMDEIFGSCLPGKQALVQCLPLTTSDSKDKLNQIVAHLELTKKVGGSHNMEIPLMKVVSHVPDYFNAEEKIHET